ncbi:MAG: hypothetical protein K8U57_32950 [Planctomycetes bacterium]|nr:hypothetical protein [Planctomycetota bacterium]
MTPDRDQLLRLMGEVQEAVDTANLSTAHPDLAPYARVVVNGLGSRNYEAACEAAKDMLKTIAGKAATVAAP